LYGIDLVRYEQATEVLREDIERDGRLVNES